MARSFAASVLATLLLAVPATAQPSRNSGPGLDNRWAIPMEPRLPLGRKGISLPVIEYAESDGRLKIRRGIVASVQVAPNTLVGIGLFETLPKTDDRRAIDNPLDVRPKRSRKAAVGISFNF
jgi:hypothetical protein